MGVATRMQLQPNFLCEYVCGLASMLGASVSFVLTLVPSLQCEVWVLDVLDVCTILELSSTEVSWYQSEKVCYSAHDLVPCEH